MRLNPDSRTDLVAALERVTSNENVVLQQISSGRKIVTPADDAAGTAALIEVQANDAATEQYLTNVSKIRTRMSASDSALNSAALALQRAVTLGVEGATGTLSDGDRQALVQELTGIQNQLLQLANTSVSGVYLFAGSAVTTTPYTADANASSGIHYEGNASTNQVEIGQSYWIKDNVPGVAIFGDDNSGVFQALANLITSVTNNSGVASANSAMATARDQFSAARVQFGNSLNQLDSMESILNDRHVELQQQVNVLSAVDMAKSASDLVSAETSRNALLEVIAKSNGLNLFDYLK